MKKELSEMTLQELWELFPIFLTPHNSCWLKWYQEEKENLFSFLPLKQVIRINHIGSTSIQNIWAKPIVDILLELPQSASLDVFKKELVNHGYFCIAQTRNAMDFNKGYTKDGFAEKVFHLHIRFFGDNDELYFRDYLNENQVEAKAYEKLKLSLWPKYEHNRDGYTNAKGEFIKKVTLLAKEKYKDRYANSN